jgi:hypothetical protein
VRFQRVAAGRPIRRSVRGYWLLVGAIAGSVVSPREATAQSDFQYWREVPAALRAVGSFESPRRTDGNATRRLALALVGRGQLYHDLYELDRALVESYARRHDSLARAKAEAASVIGPYFLARALHESGREQDARAQYARVGAGAPAAIRESARAWSAASGATTSWQRELLEFRAGRLARVTSSCPADDALCVLFRAVATRDVPGIVKGTAALSSPDRFVVKEPIRIAEGATVTLQFHDPLVYWLLGAADYVLAAHVLEGDAGATTLRGAALAQSGHARDAVAALRGAKDAYAAYLGAAQVMLGNRVADAHSALQLDPSVADAQYTAAQSSREGFGQFAGGTGGGINLARALLRHTRLAGALELLESIRPVGDAGDFRRVRPEVHILLAHTRWRLGSLLPARRGEYTLARGDLQPVVALSPQLTPPLLLLQAITLPSQGDGAGAIRD